MGLSIVWKSPRETENGKAIVKEADERATVSVVWEGVRETDGGGTIVKEERLRVSILWKNHWKTENGAIVKEMEERARVSVVWEGVLEMEERARVSVVWEEVLEMEERARVSVVWEEVLETEERPRVSVVCREGPWGAAEVAPQGIPVFVFVFVFAAAEGCGLGVEADGQATGAGKKLRIHKKGYLETAGEKLAEMLRVFPDRRVGERRRQQFAGPRASFRRLSQPEGRQRIGLETFGAG